MTGIPAFLRNSPHLPLKLGQSITNVVTMIATFYDLQLNAKDYKGSQTYRGLNGLIQFDLIGQDGELITTFVNQASGSPLVEALAAQTPVLTFGSVNADNWLAKQILVYDAAQLEQFKNYSNGYVYDAMNGINNLGYSLAKMLNLYTETPVWAHSSFADYSTAKFTLVYQGDAREAPAELDAPSDAVYIVIIRIESGQHQGLICFLAPY